MFIRFDVIHERDGQTYGQTLHDSKDRAYESHSAVKMDLIYFQTMLCISAAYAIVWCLSVHPPIGTCWYSKAILVFLYLTVGQYSNGDQPNRASNICEVYKNRDFRLISRFISEMIQYRAIVTTERQ